jgi:hypothetical protein
MIARNNCTRSILLFSAIASAILNPFITDRSHHAIASLATSNSIVAIDRDAITINTDKKLLNTFKVNGIGLGASKSSIIRAFGKPTKITIHNDLCGSRGNKLEILDYKAADFHVVNGSLEMAHFTNPKYTTESGVRVGGKGFYELSFTSGGADYLVKLDKNLKSHGKKERPHGQKGDENYELVHPMFEKAATNYIKKNGEFEVHVFLNGAGLCNARGNLKFLQNVETRLFK